MILLLLLLFGSGFLAAPAYAASEFDTTFAATYTVDTTGLTTVINDIKLTNKLSHIYASQYTLTLGSTQVSAVTAATATTTLPTAVVTDTNATTITVDFPDAAKVVGKNQTLSFTISYQNLDIASKNGRVLEVNIPKLSRLEDIDNYSVILLVPKTFDPPSLVSPQPSFQTTTSSYRLLRFDQTVLAGKSISALFGDYQNFAFNLNYHLANPNLVPALAQIALPPDTAYQRLIYNSLDPAPLTVTADPDGNWLAQYQLKPKQTLDITASGNALLYLQPTVSVPVTSSDQYLQSQPYWPTTDPQIKALAQQLTTPQAIYDYVTANLTYNYDRINDPNLARLGAAAALTNPADAICTEFTDLFIALARAAGIPSREVNGFAYTSNPKLRPLSLKKDVLHAWPEYFDPDSGGWIPVDPTWGNTTQGIDYFSRLDLNHFAFAIHATSSTSPPPAGAYKLADTTGKDIDIAFVDADPTQRVALSLAFDPPPRFSPTFSDWLPATLKITNSGNVAVHQPQLSVFSPDLALIDPRPSATIETSLPPFGQLKIPLRLKPVKLWSSGDYTVTVTVNDTSQSFNFTPPIRIPLEPILSLATGIIWACFSVFAGRLLVRRFHVFAHLRR